MQSEWTYHIEVIASRVVPDESAHFRPIGEKIDEMRRARWELVSIIAGPRDESIRYYVLTFRRQAELGQDDPTTPDMRHH